MLALRDYLRKDAKVAIDFIAVVAKKRYDSKYEAVEFQKGDKVYLKLYRSYHLLGRPLRKFS